MNRNVWAFAAHQQRHSRCNGLGHWQFTAGLRCYVLWLVSDCLFYRMCLLISRLQRLDSLGALVSCSASHSRCCRFAAWLPLARSAGPCSISWWELAQRSPFV